MTKEEYLEKLKILSKKYRKKELELKILSKEYHKKELKLEKEFAFSNNPIRIGDIISDHFQTIQVDRIQSFVGNGYPQCVYTGKLLTKKGKPFKKGKLGQIWQCNLKEDYK